MAPLSNYLRGQQAIDTGPANPEPTGNLGPLDLPSSNGQRGAYFVPRPPNEGRPVASQGYGKRASVFGACRDLTHLSNYLTDFSQTPWSRRNAVVHGPPTRTVFNQCLQPQKRGTPPIAMQRGCGPLKRCHPRSDKTSICQDGPIRLRPRLPSSGSVRIDGRQQHGIGTQSIRYFKMSLIAST